MHSAPVILGADIGGTNARFAVATSVRGALHPIAQQTFPVADFAAPEDAVAAFLARPSVPKPDRACFAIAGPVQGRTGRLTNAPWQFDADRIAATLGIADVRLCNDFEAAAYGVGELADDGVAKLNDVAADSAGMRVVLGAGTGLGVAYLAPGAPPRYVVAGEGGHATFAPANDEQAALRTFIALETGRVSSEHVLSGAGLVRCYAFTCGTRQLPDDVSADGAAAVTRRAQAGEVAAEEALRLFVSVFGGVAGDHALAVLATGGVYLAGGIAPRVIERFTDGTFMAAFLDKAPRIDLMRRMPVALVLDPHLGLLGALRRALG